MSLKYEPASEPQGAFCDDGFALGLAFLLRALDQRERLDALHWFDSVGVFLREEAQEVDKMRTDKRRATDQDVQVILGSSISDTLNSKAVNPKEEIINPHLKPLTLNPKP